MARLTLPVNPFSGITVTPSAADAPCVTVREDCATLRAKEGDALAVTARLNWPMVSASDPIASMATSPAPTGAELLAVRVSVLVWPNEIDDGLKVAVTPGGSSGAESLMVSLALSTGTA